MAKPGLFVTLIIFATTFNISFAMSTLDVDPYWKRFDPKTTVPSDAIIGGFENENLYIVRAEHENSLTPGKFAPSQHKGFISWDYRSFSKVNYEILCGNNYKWVHTTKGNVPARAVVGGKSENQQKETLYVCRAQYKGYSIPGKVHPSHNTCYIAYGNEEIRVESYEILVLPERIRPRIISSYAYIYNSVEGRDTQLKIPCTATGSPKPIVTWKLNDVDISPNSKFSIIDGALIIKKPQMNDTGIYKCVAKNTAGSTYEKFKVDIQLPPSIISSSSVIFKSVAGRDTQLKIPCVVTGHPKPIITWKVNNVNIYPNSKYSIIDRALIINKPQVSDSQKYKCEAKNDVGSAHAVFQVDIQLPPSIISSSSFIFKSVEGRDTQLKIPCVVTGHPKPIITWKVNNVNIYSNSKYFIIDGALIINKPRVSDSQKYKCEAKNDVGSAHAVFEVDIHLPPSINSSSSVIFKSVEGRDTQLKIPCVVTGHPKPIITWQIDNANISSNSKYFIIDGALIINKPQVSDSHKYKCEAKNDAGSAYAVFQTDIHLAPSINSSSSFIFKSVEGRDTQLKIPCVATGHPKPIITWKIDNANISPNSKYFIIDGALIINKPQVSDSHKYKCEAKNDAGSAYAVFQTDIHLPPTIISSSSVIFKSVEGRDTQLKIPCVVTGHPKPISTWKVNNDNIYPNSKYSIIDGALIINKPHVSDSQKYKCEAKNDVGSAHAVFQVDIHLPPSINSSSSVIFKSVEGRDTQLKIPCVATGHPEPIITWKIDNANISSNSKYFIIDGALIINKPQVSDSHKYKCEAKNDVGSAYAVFQTDIHLAPSIISSSSFIFKSVEGRDTQLKIPCVVTGHPKPIITWKLNNDNIYPNSKYSIIDGALIINKPQVSDSQKYKCEANNDVGSAHAVFEVDIHLPPSINSSSSVIFKSVEGRDTQLKIPCVVTGHPKPIITWKIDNASITPNLKYFIIDGTLIINKPQVSDSQKYKCEAKNDAGSAFAVFQTNIQQIPEVLGEADKTAVSGESIQIECKVIKGVPKPTVTWQVKTKTNSEFVSILGSENILRIPSVDPNHAGKYKCIVNNIVGEDYHLTRLTVEFAPIITSKNSTVYGIEGDIALRVPCAPIGVPQPVVTWRVDGVIITSNAHYTIADGVLIIKDPKTSDSKLYICEAKNYLGLVQASYSAEVSQFLDDFGTTREVNILGGATTNLECGSTDPSQSIRWFIEGNDSGKTGNYYDLTNPDVTFDGNYTCRRSDMNGGVHTETYVVAVGYPPTFSFDQDSVFDWSGGEDDVLICDVQAKPAADIVWKFNGKVLVDQKATTLTVPGNWGNYTCDASNVHGSIHRKFDVVSSECLIARKPKNINMPLILTPESSWPVLDSTTDYIKIQPGETVLFSCPTHGDNKNSLKIMPELNEISAICDKQDVFIAQDKQFKVVDLQCTREVDAIVIQKPIQCLTENSKLLRVGYEVRGFLESYEVCFDNSTNIPLYTRAMMSKSNGGRHVTADWYMYPGITDGINDNKTYACENSSSRCCYSKTQLVNARDFSDGPAQKSTFIDPLNAIPYWRPCDIEQSPWEDIEKTVRLQLNMYDVFVSWSGTHMIQKTNGGGIPRYLWKVLRFDEEEAVAIIYVNGPSPSEADILCKNTCADEFSVPWMQAKNKYTYCCDLDEFLQAFHFSGTSIGKEIN